MYVLVEGIPVPHYDPARPDQGLPQPPPAYPGGPPAYPSHDLPGGHFPWWLPLLIGPNVARPGTTEGALPPTHGVLPDTTKPGAWVLVAMAPGSFKWAWMESNPSNPPTTAEPK